MNVFVTGMSRGVGLAIAKTLLEDGFCVYGVSRSRPKELIELEEKYPSKLFFSQLDLSDVENLSKNLKTFIPNKVKLNGFVNNAAMAYDDIITNLNLDRLEYMYKVNVFAPMMITKHVLRNMLFNRIKGSIVHISSISAHTGYKGLAMYASTKGALESFSKNTAREWGQLGIRSNVVCPGFMDTEMSSTLTEDQKNRIFNRNSMKVPVTVENVANTVVFLVSDKSNGITGDIIHVDNGTI